MSPAQTPQLLRPAGSMELRPRYEGCNIGTWIGFKHVNYLVEEAVIEHFRRSGALPGGLYERNGLCLELTGLDTKIRSAFHVDDAVTAEVIPYRNAGELAFRVSLRTNDGAAGAASTVSVVLRSDSRGGRPHSDRPDLAGYVVPRIMDRRTAAPLRTPTGAAVEQRKVGDGRGLVAELTRERNAFGWTSRIPYFYCHFTERLQMSGYLRIMEEAVDLFLADRGVSIRTLLDEQNWIPVVPHSAIQLLEEATMEEQLHTVFTVEDVFKNLTYTARMDCYVIRDGLVTTTATGRITHGYAVIDGRSSWSLVPFDKRLMDALTGSFPAGSKDGHAPTESNRLP